MLYLQSVCRSFSSRPSKQAASFPVRLLTLFRGTVGVRRRVFGRVFGKPILPARRPTILQAVARSLHCRDGRSVLGSLRMIRQKRPVVLLKDLYRWVLEVQGFQGEAFY